MKTFFMQLLVYTYNIIILAATYYVIEIKNWSCWTIILTLILLQQVDYKHSKEKNEAH